MLSALRAEQGSGALSFGESQGKRLFGMIGSGQWIAVVATGFLMGPLSAAIGTQNLLGLVLAGAIYESVAEAADDLEAGLHIAAESIDSGKARQKLDEFLQFRAAQ